MAKRLYPLLFLSAILLLAGCQDVVELDVPDSPPEAVISGTISNEEPARVTVSTTDAFFESSRTPRISDAQVQLFENDSLLEVLTANPMIEGEYLGTTLGKIDNSYHLEVLIPEGYPGKVSGQFVTQPEVLKPVTTIDSLEIQALSRSTNPRVFEEGDYVLLYFRERPGLGDYLRINRWLNDSLFRRDIFVLDDENIDGLYFGSEQLPPFTLFGPFEDYVEPGNLKPDTFKVRFESITANYASFLQIVDEQTSVGSPFDAPPALIIGNVHRLGNKDDYAFGYFNATAFDSASILRFP